MVRYISPASYSEMSAEELKQSLIRQLTELESVVHKCLDAETYSMTWAGKGSGVFNRLNLVNSGRSPIAVSLLASKEVNGKPLLSVSVSFKAKLIDGVKCHLRIVDAHSGIVLPRSTIEITSHLEESFSLSIPWEECKRLAGEVRLEPEVMPDDYGSKAVVWDFSATLVYGTPGV